MEKTEPCKLNRPDVLLKRVIQSRTDILTRSHVFSANKVRPIVGNLSLSVRSALMVFTQEIVDDASH